MLSDWHLYIYMCIYICMRVHGCKGVQRGNDVGLKKLKDSECCNILLMKKCMENRKCKYKCMEMYVW